VRPDDRKVSIRVHLRFGQVAAWWRTEDHVDPWLRDSAPAERLSQQQHDMPLVEVQESTWLASLAAETLPKPRGLQWRHFEIVSSDAIFHVIGTEERTTGYFIEVE
jgi:hypothetical protein